MMVWVVGNPLNVDDSSSLRSMIEARRIMYANFLEEDETDVSLAYFYMTETSARRCVPNLNLSTVNLALSTRSPAAAPASCFAQGFNWFVAVRDTANPTEVVAWGHAIREASSSSSSSSEEEEDEEEEEEEEEDEDEEEDEE